MLEGDQGDPLEHDTEEPGVFMILHDKLDVRKDISIKARKLKDLRRGEEVRIVEIFECEKHSRVRGRLEATDEAKKERLWISIRNMTDDTVWAQRTAPLFKDGRKSVWAKPGMARRAATEDLGALVGDKRQSRKLRKSIKVSPEELLENPAYDALSYEDAWARVDTFSPTTSFCGTMQVQDLGTYYGRHREFPEHKQVMGGLPTQRGEWKLALAER